MASEYEATFCASVEVAIDGKPTKTLVYNKLRKVGSKNSWVDFCESLLDDIDVTDEENIALDEKRVTLCVSADRNFSNPLYPEYEDTIKTAIDFNKNLKYMKLQINVQKASPEPKSTLPSAFDVLMKNQENQQTKQARKKENDTPRFTEKDRLYNTLVETAFGEVYFPRDMSDQTVTKHIEVISNTLWYLDGAKDKIMERSKHDPNVEPLPKRFLDSFNGFNDWRRKKKHAPTLHETDLKGHSSALYNLLSCKFTCRWGSLREDIENLALSLSSYADYLQKKNREQQKRQKLDHPVRQVGEFSWLEFREKVETVPHDYLLLDDIITKLDMYQYLFFDERIHTHAGGFKDSKQRYTFIHNICLSVSVTLLTYNPGGSIGGTCFLWKVLEDRTESQLMSTSIQIFENIKPKLMEFHTREMRRQFISRYCNLDSSRIPPHILRAIYSDLTLDATRDQNPAMDARIRQAILSEDPDLVIDLRHLNTGRPNDTFESFFDKLLEKVDELSAADERRHNVCHLAKYISIPDLINQIHRELPEGTPIPSESTVLFSFVPKNSHARTAKLYKSKVNLQFKIQTRQLRTSHIDEHFCAALFKYMRNYAVNFRDDVLFACVDDKSKIDFGEPGQAVSSGVRGKKSIVPTGSALSALDHDMTTKGSITPSVCLITDIPTESNGSFYRGDVIVSYKDSIFQPSTPFRHATELEAIIRQHGVKPVLMLYSDGGPDHRVTYNSVKLALIILFKKLGLDMLVAARTAPGNSWANPAERIMSLLNLAVQNVALTRDESTSHFEQVLKSANSMSEIRNKATKVPGLKDGWIDSVKPMIQMLEERTQRLSLKDKPFQVLTAASDEEVAELERQVQICVDPAIELGKYQQQHMISKEGFKKFLNDHCVERHYIFQIKKCADPNCCSAKMSDTEFPHVPDPVCQTANQQHYKSFAEVVGKATTDASRPSAQTQTVTAVAEAAQGIRNKGLTAQNVRRCVKCYDCGKPRCIYSKKALSMRDTRHLNRLLERHDYTCGSLITPDGDALESVVTVRLQMDCATHVEFPYYASKIGQPDICAICAQPGCSRDNELLKKYKIVLPVCNTCKQSGKPIPKRNPLK